jgi:hypothetical protein
LLEEIVEKVSHAGLFYRQCGLVRDEPIAGPAKRFVVWLAARYAG